MSYCRFQNTASDLQDCLDAIDESINNGQVDIQSLSQEEYDALFDIVEQAEQIASMKEEIEDTARVKKY